MRLLIIIAIIGSTTLVNAESFIMSVLIEQDFGNEPKVSISSFFEEENVRNVSIGHAAQVLLNSKHARSHVWVGIVAPQTSIYSYQPILKSIIDHPSLEIAFIEGKGPNFVWDNIKREIKKMRAGRESGRNEK